MTRRIPSYFCPVCPNPPAPRAVSANASTRSQATRATGATSSWAIRMPAFDRKGRASQVDQRDFHFSAIVGIDRPGSIDDGDPRSRGQAGSRAHLRLESVWHRHREPAADQHDVPGREHDRPVTAAQRSIAAACAV